MHAYNLPTRMRETEEKERGRRDDEEFSFSTVTKECTKRATEIFFSLKNTTPKRQEQEEVTDIKTTSKIVNLVSAQRTQIRTMQRNNTHLH